MSQRLGCPQQAMALTRTKLQAQEKLVRLGQDFALTLIYDLKTLILGVIETLKAFSSEQFGAVLASTTKTFGNNATQPPNFL